MTGTAASPRGAKRRAAILSAARRCFIRNGLHTTSMQDLLRAANVSTGVFYHYFPSKDAVIAAVADEVLAEMSSARTGPAAVRPKSAADFLRKVIVGIERIEEENGSATLAIQLWSEALRNPRMASVAASSVKKVIDWLAEGVVELQKVGHLSDTRPAQRIAAVLLGIVHGFMVQRALLRIDARTYCLGLEGLEL